MSELVVFRRKLSPFQCDSHDLLDASVANIDTVVTNAHFSASAVIFLLNRHGAALRPFAELPSRPTLSLRRRSMILMNFFLLLRAQTGADFGLKGRRFAAADCPVATLGPALPFSWP